MGVPLGERWRLVLRRAEIEVERIIARWEDGAAEAADVRPSRPPRGKGVWYLALFGKGVVPPWLGVGITEEELEVPSVGKGGARGTATPWFIVFCCEPMAPIEGGRGGATGAVDCPKGRPMPRLWWRVAATAEKAGAEELAAVLPAPLAAAEEAAAIANGSILYLR